MIAMNCRSDTKEALDAFLGRIRRTMSAEDYEKRRLEYEKQRSDLARRQAVVESQIPQLVQEVLDREWRDLPSVAKVRSSAARMLRDKKHFLILQGPTGTGKTIAACRLLLDLLTSDRVNIPSGLFVRALDHANSQSWEPASLDAHRVAALVLDDACQEPKKRAERIEDLISDRHNKRLITIITSNLAPGRMPYDKRTKDRLIERGITVPLGEVVRPGVASAQERMF